MMSTLEGMGKGPRMMKWIQTLYKDPAAAIKVNGTLSIPFGMHNGKRPGCPLSLLLFVLALEPLLVTVRGERGHRGLQGRGADIQTSCICR